MWQATLIKYPIQRLNHGKYLGDSFVLVIDLVSRLAFGVGGVGFIQNMETSLDLISWWQGADSWKKWDNGIVTAVYI